MKVNLRFYYFCLILPFNLTHISPINKQKIPFPPCFCLPHYCHCRLDRAIHNLPFSHHLLDIPVRPECDVLVNFHCSIPQKDMLRLFSPSCSGTIFLSCSSTIFLSCSGLTGASITRKSSLFFSCNLTFNL